MVLPQTKYTVIPHHAMPQILYNYHIIFFPSLSKQDHLDHHASTSKPASGFSRLFSRTRKREQQKLLQQQQQEQLKAASGEKDMVNINVKEIQKGNWLSQYSLII